MSENRTQAGIVDGQVLGEIGHLDVVATRIVEGYLAGMHRSPFKGGCVEFAEHRPYSPGDEVRLIDWRLFARSDRYHIKQFEEETNLQAMLVVDGSGSMGFGMETVSKLRYAQVLAASLSRLLLHQRDAVGLAVADERVRSFVPPRAHPGHFRALVENLENVRAGGRTSLAGVLRDVGKRLRRRGLVLVLTDAFEDEDALLDSLRLLSVRGHEPWLVHVMAPEELSFSFKSWSRFECLEAPEWRMDLDPAMIRKRYLERVRAFLDRLQSGCAQAKCDYTPVVTHQPIGQMIGYYLSRRMARVKSR